MAECKCDEIKIYNKARGVLKGALTQLNYAHADGEMILQQHKYNYTCRVKLANTSVDLVKINESFEDTDGAAADRASDLFGGSSEG